MQTDPVENPTSQLRRRAAEVVERSLEEARLKLQRSGVPEAKVLEVMPRIRDICVVSLNEYDQAFLTVEQAVERNGRSPAHQRWINDKAALLLRQIEAGIAELVAIAIRQTLEDLQRQLSRPREVIDPVRYEPPSTWQQFLERLQHWANPTGSRLLWAGVLSAWFLLWWLLSGSFLLGMIALSTAVVLIVFRRVALFLFGIFGAAVFLLLLI